MDEDFWKYSTNAFDPDKYRSGPSFMDSVKAGEELFGPGGSLSNYGSSSSGGYTSNFGKWAEALNKSNIFKQSSQNAKQGYQGGWAQPFAQGSGANYQSMGEGKGIYTFPAAKIAGIVNHPIQQQSSGGGFFDRLAGGVKGFMQGAMTGQPHMAGVGAAAGFLSA